MRNLFCCYSLPLRDYLRSVGIKYELCALNPNNHKMFWVFLRNEQLNVALDKWARKDV